ncbi:MarR family winged helix-turn-helix transcriptional regulator [Roseomonas sp. CCTCC AB2023176]|uniref:MarR family winged helix-turn-helix transcriptional regulator n=1 Tax=Roseomonas sp. CCTCC AB2023176 TaxID=3342640 RepID=UPI0035DC1E30
MPLAPGAARRDDAPVPTDTPRLKHRTEGSVAAGGSTFFQFVLLVNLVARPFARVHERVHGLRLAEWRVLRALSLASGPITAGVLGEALGMDKMAVSRAVRALEARARLHRRPDPEDGRRIALEITPEGRTLVARIEPSGREREAALLAALTEEERATLDALLDRLVARARALPDPDLDRRTDQNP